jgi:hypothetical protein
LHWSGLVMTYRLHAGDNWRCWWRGLWASEYRLTFKSGLGGRSSGLACFLQDLQDRQPAFGARDASGKVCRQVGNAQFFEVVM